MKNFKFLIIILILLKSLNGAWVKPVEFNKPEKFNLTPVNSRYYRDEFKKPYFHLSAGAGIGFDYYLNYSENNNFFPYMLYLVLNNETDVKHFGAVLKFEILFETDEWSDERSYNSSYFKFVPSIYFGITYKLESPLPYIKYFIPYFQLGAGGIMAKSKNDFFDSYKNLHNTEIESWGSKWGIELGNEFVFVNHLFSVDLGIKYNYYNLTSSDINISGPYGGRTYESELKDEFLFLIYLGLRFNIF